MTETVRLSKLLADRQGCSRREAENYIHGGWVSVEGEVVEEPGFRVATDAAISLDPKARPDDVPPVTLLLHKPSGAGASTESETAAQWLVPENRFADAHGHLRTLKKHFSGLMLATPLETDASGLIVATQDARVMSKLVDQANRLEQEFIVDVTGTIAPDGLALLGQGLSWQGRPLPAIKVSWQSENRLRFALKTPALGLIAHMCREVGLTVTAMRRIRIGRLPMAGLPVGQWRYLQGYERF